MCVRKPSVRLELFAARCGAGTLIVVSSLILGNAFYAISLLFSGLVHWLASVANNGEKCPFMRASRNVSPAKVKRSGMAKVHVYQASILDFVENFRNNPLLSLRETTNRRPSLTLR